MAKAPDETAVSKQPPPPPAPQAPPVAVFGETTEQQPEIDTEMVRVVVHQRRSVMHRVAVGTRLVAGKMETVFKHRTAQGGEMIEVPAADAVFLRAHGFLHEPNAPVMPMQAGLPLGSYRDGDLTRPTVNGDDGSVIRGG